MPDGIASSWSGSLANSVRCWSRSNWDLSLTGFDASEIDALFADLDEKPDPAETVPALDEAAVSRAGDLWHLRDHRLLCGDARSQVRP